MEPELATDAAASAALDRHVPAGGAAEAETFRERLAGRVSAAGRRAATATLAAVSRGIRGVGFDPFSPRFLDDPYPVYAALRDRDPIHRMLAGPWVVTRFADCEAMLRDPRLSADDRNLPRFQRRRRQLVRAGILTEEESRRSPSMLRLDAPEHTRLRRAVQRSFTPRRVEELRGWLEGVVDDLLDRARCATELEVMEQLARPLPVTAIAELIGVPPAWREPLRRWSDALVLTLGPASAAEMRRGVRAGRAFRELLVELAHARRHKDHGDLLSALMSQVDSPDGLDEGEVLTTCGLLLVAGHETTTNLIGNAVLALHDHPEAWDWIRADPEKNARASVDELLRYDSPVQATGRVAREDIEWNGVRIPRGAEIALMLGSANRDPEVFPDPDRLILTRSAGRHIALGLGAHYCLGAALARLECEVAVRSLAARFPQIELAAPPRRGRSFILRGVEQLVIRMPRA